MNVTVPDALSGFDDPVVSGCSMMVAACAADVMTGVSLLPTIMMITGWLAMPPW